MSKSEQLKVGDTPAYWVHNVKPGPVMQGRLAQLIDDAPLSEAAKRVYRFLLYWYMDAHGDALASIREIVKIMKQRAPAGASLLSRSAASRAVIELLETGWLVRTYRARARDKGLSGSRYVPVQMAALEAAAKGEFPKPSHQAGQFEHISNRPSSRDGSGKTVPTGGTVTAETVPPVGTKTRIPDTVTREPCTGSDMDIAPVADGHSATAPDGGFDRLAAAYAKRGDNLLKARRAFEELALDGNETERMIAAAMSWRKSASGKRMSLARWIEERRWVSDKHVANDNRTSFRWPSCVVTAIRPKIDAAGEAGASIKYRDRNGELQTRVLNRWEFDDLALQCKHDRPAVERPSDDLHEFVGARFQVLGDGEFGYYEQVAA